MVIKFNAFVFEQLHPKDVWECLRWNGCERDAPLVSKVGALFGAVTHAIRPGTEKAVLRQKRRKCYIDQNRQLPCLQDSRKIVPASPAPRVQIPARDRSR